MIFHELELKSVYWLELEKKEDQRGFFARSFCEDELRAKGLVSHFPQCNISFNTAKWTLRGMHFSVQPAAEVKIVRCTRGAVYDVLVDLRPGSSTYLKWISIHLSSENRKVLYIPEGIAHGFQTLAPDCELFYHMSVPYDPSCARGVRWNDPTLSIKWPNYNPILSPRDQEFPSVSK